MRVDVGEFDKAHTSKADSVSATRRELIKILDFLFFQSHLLIYNQNNTFVVQAYKLTQSRCHLFSHAEEEREMSHAHERQHDPPHCTM